MLEAVPVVEVPTETVFVNPAFSVKLVVPASIFISKPEPALV